MAAGRRQFIAGLGAAAAGAGLATPALADPAPNVQWRLTSSFQPSLDLIYGGGETLASALSDMTDGRFTLKLSAAGEIAPALEALDAVADGRAECAHTALSYYWNKDPSFVFGSSTPFGMNARQHAAWLQEGGGGCADRRTARRAQGFRAAGRQHRRADGGLVPQGNPRARRFRRPQAAHRRLCRQSVPDARRRAGGDGQGRHLFGARIGRARRVRMGRPL